MWLVAALLATTSSGCSLSNNGPAVPGVPPHMPRDCVRLFVKVPDPGAAVGQDLGDIAAGYKGAWRKANNRIERGGACVEHQADAVDRGAR